MIILKLIAERLQDLVEESFEQSFMDSPHKMASLRAEASTLANVVLAEIEDKKNTTPKIIRTFEDLETLDPNTILGVWHKELEMGCIFLEAREWLEEEQIPPLAIIATGEQVRAARKALN